MGRRECTTSACSRRRGKLSTFVDITKSLDAVLVLIVSSIHIYITIWFKILMNHSIFELHIEKVLKVRDLATERGASVGGVPSIPIYVMTSAINDKTIKGFFRQNDYFGCEKEDIYFFEQGLEPCLSLDEKLIIEAPDSVAMAPDGNGGIYNALKKTGALQDMIKRGVKHLHIYGIDNILTKAADPLFIGLCIDRNVQAANKVVWRASKSEKVGTTVSIGGRMKVLEYSEIPEDLSDAVDADGKLLFGAANICNHYLSVEFLEDLIPKLDNLYHLAEKKIPYYDPVKKQVVKPDKANGLKLEMFIFDVFPYADRWLVAEVNREDEFAPVKNAPGSKSDSPDTARELISEQAVRWLRNAGAVVEEKTIKGGLGEISVQVSYSGEGLTKYAGVTLRKPFYIRSNEPPAKTACMIL